jgi:hypothetical protein
LASCFIFLLRASNPRKRMNSAQRNYRNWPRTSLNKKKGVWPLISRLSRRYKTKQREGTVTCFIRFRPVIASFWSKYVRGTGLPPYCNARITAARTWVSLPTTAVFCSTYRIPKGVTDFQYYNG